jgi:hypothetical protein
MHMLHRHACCVAWFISYDSRHVIRDSSAGLTKEGLEVGLGAMHVGHWYLTMLLGDMLLEEAEEVCVRACVRERERERESVCMRVCECMSVEIFHVSFIFHISFQEMCLCTKMAQYMHAIHFAGILTRFGACNLCAFVQIYVCTYPGNCAAHECMEQIRHH